MKKNGDERWDLWSRQGSVLLFIAFNPDCTVLEIAANNGLTERAIWDHIGDLRRAGMIESRRDGRRNRYRVNLDGPFKHPTIRNVTLRTLLSGLLRAASHDEVGAAAH